MDGSVVLISETFEKDSIGQQIPTETRTEILCYEKSVTRAEFDSAGQHGLSADLVLVTQAVNYEGQSIAEYNSKRYGIYRTYRNPDSDEIELYMERKAGA